MFKIKLMTEKYAKEICGWHYEGIYEIYSFDQDAFDELMNGEYYSCVKDNYLIGYFCFGKSAQIPTIQKVVYNDNILDIGLGLKPELCGKGLGREFLKAGIEFSKAERLRLTVAAFNKRGIKLYESIGFSKINEVNHLYSKTPFDIMVKVIK